MALPKNCGPNQGNFKEKKALCGQGLAIDNLYARNKEKAKESEKERERERDDSLSLYLAPFHFLPPLSLFFSPRWVMCDGSIFNGLKRILLEEPRPCSEPARPVLTSNFLTD